MIIPTIGIIVNTKKDKAVDLAGDMIDFLQQKSADYLVEEACGEILDCESRAASVETMKKKVDYLTIFGGDGTMLRAVGKFCGTDIPMLGINVGSLGFMTVIEAESLREAAGDLLQGDFSLEERMMLNTRVFRQGEKIYDTHGLNDAVISRGGNQKVIGMEFYIGEEFIADYQGDGMIAATPTGSTAYSLSAGGPIVNPELDVLLLTPICPHNLYIRPMMIKGNEQVKIRTHVDRGQVKISTDGKKEYDLQDGDEIIINKSKHSVKMVKFPERNFYRILREKLKLGLF